MEFQNKILSNEDLVFVYNKNNSKVRNWLNVCARERVSERVQCVINLWLKMQF